MLNELFSQQNQIKTQNGSGNHNLTSDRLAKKEMPQFYFPSICRNPVLVTEI